MAVRRDNALTRFTGGMLLSLSLRWSDDLALHAWMWINALWLVSDLEAYPSVRDTVMAFGGVGAALLLAAFVRCGGSSEALSLA